jgi:hypothetical protein
MTLTVTPFAPCTAVTDQMVLTISKSATANAGPDATICGGEPFDLSGASASNYISVTWTTSGTGTFNDVHLVNPVYTPSMVDIITGNVILTMTVDPMVPCGPASAHMSLTLTGTPVANAGPNGSACDGVPFTITGATAVNYSSILWTTTGLGVLSGSTTLTPTYTPSPGESGTVILDNDNPWNYRGVHKYNSDQPDEYHPISHPITGQCFKCTIRHDTTEFLPRHLLGQPAGGSGVYAFSWQPASLLIDASYGSHRNRQT